MTQHTFPYVSQRKQLGTFLVGKGGCYTTGFTLKVVTFG